MSVYRLQIRNSGLPGNPYITMMDMPVVPRIGERIRFSERMLKITDVVYETDTVSMHGITLYVVDEAQQKQARDKSMADLRAEFGPLLSMGR